MMSSFTPGPWTVKSAREGTYEIVAVTDKYDKEGKNITFTVAAFVRKADAMFIAAAPEMYELLRGELLDGDAGVLSFTREARISDILRRIEGKEGTE